MKQKGQVAKVAEHVLSRLEVQSGKNLKTVRTSWEGVRQQGP